MAFQPGQSGNPNGRPKAAKIITQQIIAALNEVDPKTEATKLRGIVNALISKATEGDVSAIKEVADRAEGKVPQTHEGGDEENPINVLHRIERVIVRPSKPEA